MLTTGDPLAPSWSWPQAFGHGVTADTSLGEYYQSPGPFQPTSESYLTVSRGSCLLAVGLGLASSGTFKAPQDRIWLRTD